MSEQGALSGVKVLDLTRVLAGPWCTMMLSDLGAEVIKIESPEGGDYTRHWGTALPHGESPYFLGSNRNKRSIAVDFSRADGQAILRQLILQCDVLVENYLTGTLEKYGLGWNAVSELNPRLVYCSISGYGRSGPRAHMPGYDPIIQGECGLMAVTGEVDGRPIKAGVTVVDVMAGMYAAYGVLAAILARQQSGKGQLLDISLLDCALSNLASVGANALLLNKVPPRFGNAHADVVPFDTYPTSDGYLTLAVGNDAQFQRLCREVLCRTDLAENPKYSTNAGRRANRAELDPALSECFRRASRADWLHRLESAGVPAGSVRNALEALNSSEASARGMVTEVEHPTEGLLRLVASPLRFSGSPVSKASAPPLLGQHTDEVLTQMLGYSQARILELRAAGVVV